MAEKARIVVTPKMRTAFRVFLITVAATLLPIAVLAIVGNSTRWPEPETPPQQGEAATPENHGEKQAHRADALARLIREPQNTWSNLAFVAGGAVLIAGGAGRMTRVIGVALVGVGIGSFLYHASASRTLRHLDVAAMYWLFLLAGASALGALRAQARAWLDRHAFALLAASLVAAVALTLARNVRLAGVKPFSLTIATGVTATLIIAALARVAWLQRSLPSAAAIVALFAAAVTCQLGDRPGGWLFAPGAPVQAHALRHVLSAAAMVLAVRLLDARPHQR